MTNFGGFDVVQGCYPGGGNSPDPGEPSSWDDGTGRPACERDANEHCITRELSAEEWARLGAAIEAIPEGKAECTGAKNALRGFYAQGRASQRLRFWDGYDKPSANSQRYGQNLSDAQGRYIEYDSYHIWHLRSLLVHEGLHAWLAENPSNAGLVTGPNGLSNEQWVESMAQGCV